LLVNPYDWKNSNGRRQLNFLNPSGSLPNADSNYHKKNVGAIKHKLWKILARESKEFD
jgi:hypothetical protein